MIPHAFDDKKSGLGRFMMKEEAKFTIFKVFCKLLWLDPRSLNVRVVIGRSSRARGKIYFLLFSLYEKLLFFLIYIFY
jgi:hypothetical protein